MKRGLFQFTFVGVLIHLLACTPGEDNDITMRLFNRNISLDKQLKELETCGIIVNDGVVESDLVAFDTKDQMEKEPYKGLVEVLGIELERKPYTPLSNSLWMCDYERIEDHGAYKEIIERLELMTGSALGLSEVEDHVDVEDGVAWVEFTHEGKRIHWDAEVDNDWMDPYIIVKYDELLKMNNVRYRIYSNHTDYGQVAFIAAFTPEQFKCFRKLSKIRLVLIESQA